MLGGKCIIKTGVTLRGDLRRPVAPPPSSASTSNPALAAQRAAAAQRSGVVMATGRYCLFDEGSVIRPPYKTFKGSFSYFAVKFGDFVRIGPGSVVQASAIGSHVDIGRNCVIGRWCFIKDCAVILDGTVLAPSTMVPSLTVWGGSPGMYALPDVSIVSICFRADSTAWPSQGGRLPNYQNLFLPPANPDFAHITTNSSQHHKVVHHQCPMPFLRQIPSYNSMCERGQANAFETGLPEPQGLTDGAM